MLTERATASERALETCLCIETARAAARTCAFRVWRDPACLAECVREKTGGARARGAAFFMCVV